MKELKTCFVHAFNFKGCATRREFITLWLLRYAMPTIFAFAGWLFNMNEYWLTRLYACFWILTFVPMLSLTVRRLHDLERSGWWYLVSFLPGANILFVIYLACKKGVSEGAGPEEIKSRGCFVAMLIFGASVIVMIIGLAAIGCLAEPYVMREIKRLEQKAAAGTNEAQRINQKTGVRDVETVE